MPELNLDRLNSISPARAGSAALGALEGMRRFTPEEQVSGMAVAFAELLAKYGVHAGKALEVAFNLRTKAYASTPEIRAVRAFTEGEL